MANELIKQLKLHKEEKALKLVEVADNADMDFQSVWRFFQNKIDSKISTVQRIGDAVGYELVWRKKE